jgi:hypothetical protein
LKGQKPFEVSHSQKSQVAAVADLEILDHQPVKVFDQAERMICAFQGSCHYCSQGSQAWIGEQILQRWWIRQGKQNVY